jgi:4-amino-4-deoxy-L-arabinose transferase-like glycosyltransferase
LNNRYKVKRAAKFPLAGLLLLLLIAYTGSAPFRHLYGLEARNALFAKEMLQNGFSLIPTALGKPYPDYPGLYFWIETFFSHFSGHVNTLSAVLPSSIFAVGSVVITFFLGCRINRQCGWFAAAILATFPDFWLRASQATIDILLTFHVAAALACLFFGEESLSTRRMAYRIGAFFFMVLAFFTKGPIGIVLPAAAWGAYLLMERRFKSLFRFILISGMVAALCVAIQLWIVWRTGGGHLIREVVISQVTGRLGEKANHPPYYYATTLLANGGIWLIMALPAAGKWLRRKRDATWKDRGLAMLPGHPVTRIALIWFVITFTIFTLASTRHTRYLLPLFPALAILIAYSIDGMLRRENNRFFFFGTVISVLIAIILLAGVVAAIIFADRVFVPPTCIAIWIVTVAWIWMILKRRVEKGPRMVGLITLFLAAGLSGVNLLVIPQLSHRASGRQFTEAAEATVDPNIPVVLYRIGADGDGIKYALYSKRRPSALHFVKTKTALKVIPPPYLLISPEGPHVPVWRAVLPGKIIVPLVHGKIRSHQFGAYLIDASSKLTGTHSIS